MPMYQALTVKDGYRLFPSRWGITTGEVSGSGNASRGHSKDGILSLPYLATGFSR